MPEKTMKIRFTEPRRVLDHNRRVVAKFSAGEVVELSEASARHWLNRNIAKIVGAAAEPEPEDEDLRPEGDALMAAIAAAVGELDAESDDHFTKDDVPKVEALERVLGYGISAAERDAAWATVNE